VGTFGLLDTPEPEAGTRFSQDPQAEEVTATAVNHDHKVYGRDDTAFFSLPLLTPLEAISPLQINDFSRFLFDSQKSKELIQR
jgi:hypothetical protein